LKLQARPARKKKVGAGPWLGVGPKALGTLAIARRGPQPTQAAQHPPRGTFGGGVSTAKKVQGGDGEGPEPLGSCGQNTGGQVIGAASRGAGRSQAGPPVAPERGFEAPSYSPRGAGRKACRAHLPTAAVREALGGERRGWAAAGASFTTRRRL